MTINYYYLISFFTYSHTLNKDWYILAKTIMDAFQHIGYRISVLLIVYFS